MTISDIPIIVGYEESQAVCKEFRKIGFEAYSCDLKPCSGGHPEWHFQMSIFDAIKIKKFKLGIFHPPCTHLCIASNAHLAKKKADGRLDEAIKLFKDTYDFDIDHMCLENPIGIMSGWKQPTQIIQPFHFGDTARKATCLWLKNLPPLFYADKDDLFSQKTTVEPRIIEMTSNKTGRTRTYSKWEYKASKNHNNRAEIRSKTFPGIAKAMADQWGDYLKNKYKIS